MKISTNITQAQSNYPEMYHVVNSNEVHSFKTRNEAQTDYENAVNAEKEINSGFEPEFVD